jgi:eukaryotic-like serine/threonine-protein kinase
VSKPVSSHSVDTITGGNAVHALPSGSVLAQRYRIESLLGIGGMGMVYRATDLSLGVEVALKLLRPELTSRSEAFERFRQEVLLARQVSNPHVVRIHDMARDGSNWFISMDYVDGEPLDRLLDRDGPMPVERALQLTAQIASGLAAAHAQHVVHRDLKPSNVLVDSRGNAVIADFGVARSLGGTGMTHTGAIVGTPDYLSPEQARGSSIDARSDLYTLGLLLYEMLSGQLPFSASTPSEALSQRLSGHLPPIERRRRDLPPWVARLVARLLKPNPAHRFQSADQVVAAIEARRVARDWRPLAGRLAAAGAVLALVFAAVLWLPELRAPAPVPPPDRILILPLEYDGVDLPRPALAALSEHIRMALAVASTAPVVDGERTAQALVRAGQSSGDPVNAELLLQDLPALSTLRLRLASERAGFRLGSEWRRGGGPALLADSGVPQPTPIEAADLLLLRLREQVGADSLAVGPGLLPADMEALGLYGEGLQLRRQGQLESALQHFEAAAARDPGYASAWLAMAETAMLAGDPIRLATAISYGRELPSPAVADAFDLLGLWQAGEWEAAEARLRERLRLAPDDLYAQLQLAEVLGERGEYHGAEEILAELVVRDPGEARAWFLRGKFAILRGMAQPAVDEYLVRAVLLFKRYRNRFGEAEAVNALGVGYARLGQIGDAEEQYRKALELREAIGHRRGAASSLRNLAQLATVRGQVGEAAGLLDRARRLFERIEDSAGLAAVDNELGVLAEERGDFDQALEAYRRALRSREALGDRHGAAETLNNIGFAHYQLGDYDSARVFWQQSSDAFLQLDDLSGATRSGQNLGMLELVRGRWSEARRLLEASLQTAERQHMAEEIAVSRRHLGKLALLQGRFDEALDHLQRAQALFVEREDLRGLVDVSMLRARVLLAAGAADAVEAALDELDGLLPQASAEQRAMGALLRAELAELRGRRSARLAAVEAARQQIGAAGSRALLLQIELASGRSDDPLGQDIRAAGHRRLWLVWAEQAMTARAAQPSLVIEIYRDVQIVLREVGRYEGAWRIHRLAAAAFAALGEAPAAVEASAMADDALQRLRQTVPAGLRDAFDEHAYGNGSGDD